MASRKQSGAGLLCSTSEPERMPSTEPFGPSPGSGSRAAPGVAAPVPAVAVYDPAAPGAVFPAPVVSTSAPAVPLPVPSTPAPSMPVAVVPLPAPTISASSMPAQPAGAGLPARCPVTVIPRWRIALSILARLPVDTIHTRPPCARNCLQNSHSGRLSRTVSKNAG